MDVREKRERGCGCERRVRREREYRCEGEEEEEVQRVWIGCEWEGWEGEEGEVGVTSWVGILPPHSFLPSTIPHLPDLSRHVIL